MTKYIHPNVHDQGLNYIVANADRLVVVSGDPADFAAVAAITLASINVVGGDFTIANGDTSGRKITCAAKSGTVSAQGDAAHIVWVDDTNSLMLYKTEETGPQTLFVGNTVNVPATVYESRDPA